MGNARRQAVLKTAAAAAMLARLLYRSVVHLVVPLIRAMES